MDNFRKHGLPSCRPPQYSDVDGAGDDYDYDVGYYVGDILVLMLAAVMVIVLVATMLMALATEMEHYWWL